MHLDKLFVIDSIIIIHLLIVIRFSVFSKSLLLFVVSMACALIASKIEEELRPVSRIIKIFHSLYLHRTNQEIKDLEDTDSVIYVISLISVGISILEKDLNGN